MAEDNPARKRIVQLLQKCAAEAVAQGDPWAEFNLVRFCEGKLIFDFGVKKFFL